MGKNKGWNERETVECLARNNVNVDVSDKIIDLKDKVVGLKLLARVDYLENYKGYYVRR